MCKPGKSFNTGVKTSYLSSHKDALQKKNSRAGGAPPHTDNRIRQAARGQGQVGLFKTTRERGALSLLLTL